jgi:hypothetical protein
MAAMGSEDAVTFLEATDEGVLLIGDDQHLYELAWSYWNCRCCVSFNWLHDADPYPSPPTRFGDRIEAEALAEKHHQGLVAALLERDVALNRIERLIAQLKELGREDAEWRIAEREARVARRVELGRPPYELARVWREDGTLETI